MNTEPPQIFDRALLRRRRDRLAASMGCSKPTADFLFQEVAEQLCDRLLDFKRQFPVALEIGARNGLLETRRKGRGGITTFIRCDLSSALLGVGPMGPRVAADEERLPFRSGKFDLVLSNLCLHWINDLPGTLAQIRDVLKPDGLFLASMFGGGTLTELRQSMMDAEIAETGGAAARVSPFAELRDAAGLLQRAGFALPVADATTIRATYADAFQLVRDLRAMGETSVLRDRPRRATTRATLARAAAIYHQRFADSAGRVPATFQVLFLTGWAPHYSQQRPAARGSGTIKLGDALSEP